MTTPKPCTMPEIKCDKCKCQMVEEDFTKEAVESFKKGDCILECYECFTDGYGD